MISRGLHTTPPAFCRFVFALDERLRRHYAIFDYAKQSNCILRIHFEKARAETPPTDGLSFGPGERVAILHWRNDRFPLVWGDRGDFGRALALAKKFEGSLRALAANLDGSPKFDNVVAIRAVMPWRGTQPLAHIERLAAGFGFHAAAEPRLRGLLARLHRLGENILILLLVLACNPSAASLLYLTCDRIALTMPREILDRKYGRSRDRRASDSNR